MFEIRSHIPLAVLCALSCFPPVLAGEPFTLRDGDRIAFVGGTFVERDQLYGDFETWLTASQPNIRFSFRNLGWSGDTVTGIARARFGSPADGFKHLQDTLDVVRPTQVLVCYGANEAFDGAPGLPQFQSELGRMLDLLGRDKAQLALISPLRLERHGPPLPDPAPQNERLALYVQALRDAAAQRGATFVDLFGTVISEQEAANGGRLTENGQRLTPLGAWRAALALGTSLGLSRPDWTLEISRDGVRPVRGVKVGDFAADNDGLQWTALDDMLPLAMKTDGTDRATFGTRTLRVRGLAAGKHRLLGDGVEIAIATAEEWAAGVALDRGPEFAQSAALRDAIRDKNELFFHRYRPQNETYLFGFRKHEQGQNAKEVPEFDALIEAAEAKIHELARPVAHKYELRPAP